MITFVACILGIVHYRYWAYWKWVVLLLAWALIVPLLFAASGTLENPSGDGFVTHQVRIASNDGPGVDLIWLVATLVYWGVVIWLIIRMYFATKKHGYAGQTASVLRKGFEVAALCVALGFGYLVRHWL